MQRRFPFSPSHIDFLPSQIWRQALFQLDEPFAGVDPIAVEDIQHIVWKLKDKNIGILITDHNALETLRLTDRAYLLFDGNILFQGTPEELSVNPVVREKYLGSNFVLTRKDFQKTEEMRNKRIEEQTRL